MLYTHMLFSFALYNGDLWPQASADGISIIYRTLHERSEHALNMQIKQCKMIPQPASIIDVALFKKLVDMLPCMMSGYRCDHRDLRESRNSWIKCSFPSSSIYRGSDNLWPCSQKIYYKMKNHLTMHPIDYRHIHIEYMLYSQRRQLFSQSSADGVWSAYILDVSSET